MPRERVILRVEGASVVEAARLARLEHRERYADAQRRGVHLQVQVGMYDTGTREAITVTFEKM